MFSPFVLLSFMFFTGGMHQARACLPPDIAAADVVSTEVIRTVPSGKTVKKITVQQKITELKARCRKSRLVDAGGREVRFYRLKGCWGFPPPDYQEILLRQRNELEELKKKFTVIELTCNPSGLSSSIH